MFDKCIFDSWECRGERKEVIYNKPFEHEYFTKVYLCDEHKDCRFDWRDALNTRSNIKTINAKMTHTKELSETQGSIHWLRIMPKIKFCPACNGTGENGDNIDAPIPCKECNCTGRC